MKNIRYKFKRYFLAIIGLAIGISCVISMGYLGIVAKYNLINDLKKEGVDLIFVYPERVKFSPAYPSLKGIYKSLKLKDLFFISRFIPHVYLVVPEKSFTAYCKFGENLIENVRIVGTDIKYLKMMNYKILMGNYPEFRNGILIGYSIYKNLFNYANPIGRYLNINGKFLKISGVLNEKGVNESGEDQDKIVIMPLSLFMEKFNNENYLNRIYVRPERVTYQTFVKNSINSILDFLHYLNIYPDKQKDFSIKSMDYYLKKQIRMAQLMTLSTLIVSSISLIVGGIGIMAILLILSIEETREIGVKRAFGATKIDIFKEYLIRSIYLSLIGSILGLFIGGIIYFIINELYKINLGFPLSYALSGILFNILVGFIFGLFPAIKAANISVIDALKYE